VVGCVKRPALLNPLNNMVEVILADIEEFASFRDQLFCRLFWQAVVLLCEAIVPQHSFPAMPNRIQLICKMPIGVLWMINKILPD
jgi:hypothetical protein